MSQVLSPLLAGDRSIIKIRVTILFSTLYKNTTQQSVEGGWGCFQPKRRDLELIKPERSDKGCDVLGLLLKWDLPIAFGMSIVEM